MQSSETATYLFINKAGAIVVNASGYEGAGNFSEGLAAVFDRHKGWGFIDKTGAVVIQPRFEGSLGFREGLAPVVLAGKWGFIDKAAHLVIENQFEWVGEFSEGLAVVQRATVTATQNVAHLPVGQTIVETFTFLTGWSLTIAMKCDDGRFLLTFSRGMLGPSLSRSNC